MFRGSGICELGEVRPHADHGAAAVAVLVRVEDGYGDDVRREEHEEVVDVAHAQVAAEQVQAKQTAKNLKKGSNVAVT